MASGRSELLALYQYHNDLNYRIDFDVPKIGESIEAERTYLCADVLFLDRHMLVGFVWHTCLIFA